MARMSFHRRAFDKGFPRSVIVTIPRTHRYLAVISNKGTRVAPRSRHYNSAVRLGFVWFIGRGPFKNVTLFSYVILPDGIWERATRARCCLSVRSAIV